MTIYRADVVSTVDLSEEGKIMVSCGALSDDFFQVTYVSPYYTNFQGGMIAIPDKGASILITRAGNEDHGWGDWYYLGSIVDKKPKQYPKPDKSENSPNLPSNSPVMPQESIYTNNAPKKVVLKSPMGNCLTLSDQNTEKYNNVKAELRSAQGKRLLLADSDGIGAIILENEDGDGIKIISNRSKHFPTRSIQIESENSQSFRSLNGDINMLVVDGQDINITNKATGIMSLLPTDTTVPVFIDGGPLQTGNINLKSKWRDINITCDNKVTGRVFVHAGEKIQLEATTGEVIIHAASKVTIAAGPLGIDMISAGDIKMTAAGAVDIVGGVSSSFGSLGGNTHVVAPVGMVTVDAPVGGIHLNSGLSAPAIPILELQLGEAVYKLLPTSPLYVVQNNNYGDPQYPDIGT